jgi:hypothetical protein
MFVFTAFFLFLPTANCLLPTVLVSAGHRQSGVHPGLSAAEQSRDILDSVFFHRPRRTGAGLFGGSRAVRDNHLVTRQFSQARFRLV